MTETPTSLLLVTGMSGAGKSIALKMLEDSGFYCVDNLPAELLTDCVRSLAQHGTDTPPLLAVAEGVTEFDKLGDFSFDLSESVIKAGGCGSALGGEFFDRVDSGDDFGNIDFF